jgi:hypothetical protein
MREVINVLVCLSVYVGECVCVACGAFMKMKVGLGYINNFRTPSIGWFAVTVQQWVLASHITFDQFGNWAWLNGSFDWTQAIPSGFVKCSGNTRNLNGWLSLIIVLPIGPLKSITSCAPDDWRINLPPVTRHWSCNFRSSWSARGQIHGWNLAYCQWYWEIVFIQFDQVFVHSNHSTRYIRDYINEFRECFFFPGMPSEISPRASSEFTHNFCELRLWGIAFQGCSGLCHWDLIKIRMRGDAVDFFWGVPMWVTITLR